jgi:hypothetical protein
MADEQQKAAPVAEKANGQEKAPEMGHEPNNGVSSKEEVTKEATESTERSANPGAKESEPTHKDTNDRKSKDREHRKPHIPSESLRLTRSRETL